LFARSQASAASLFFLPFSSRFFRSASKCFLIQFPSKNQDNLRSFVAFFDDFDKSPETFLIAPLGVDGKTGISRSTAFL